MFFVNTNSNKASLNFAYEYYFASKKKLDESILLLWNTTPCVMIGKYQIIPEEINVKYAQKHNIEIIRRMSGGGTIFTDQGSLQFSVIENGKKEISFEKYMTPIVKALASMGINAAIDGRNDIVLGDKKISGNAQYKVHDYTVHHGSLLFDADIDTMENVTSLPNYKIQSKGIKSVKSRVINLQKYANGINNIDEFRNNIKKQFEPIEEYIITEDDFNEILKIEKELFPVELFEMIAAGPAFDIEKHIKFSEGNIVVGMSIKKGIIVNASIRGDFFSESDIDCFAKALIGKHYSKEELYNEMKNSELNIYGISIEEIASSICEIE